jgi:hypothetical protein
MFDTRGRADAPAQTLPDPLYPHSGASGLGRLWDHAGAEVSR